MKILLLGKNGQLGWELQRTLFPLGSIIPLSSTDLDLASENNIRSTIKRIKPDMIVNAAAYTDVENAETDPELAMQINGTAPGILAEEAYLLKALLVHYSTDYVFDGQKREAYSELDSPNPINQYGVSKLAGENAIRQTGADHYIFRSSWIYGLRGKNFLLTVLRLAGKQKKLHIVNDQFSAPNWSRAIAEATALILAKSNRQKSLYGLYNLSASGQTTWYEFAQTSFALLVKNGIRTEAPELVPISSEDYGSTIKRPTNSYLSCNKLQNNFDLVIPDWWKTLELALAPDQANFN